MSGTGLVSVFKQVAKDAQQTVKIVHGQVTSINPILIKIENRFEIGIDFLILSPFCQETAMWRGLQLGDTVLVMKMTDNQTYYVLQREGEL